MAKKKKGLPTTQDVDAIISALNKKIGIPVAGRLKDFDLSYSVMPTGSLAIDIATGIGGLASGRMYEISGNFSSGKSTLAVNSIRHNQANSGRFSLYCDAECAIENSLFTGMHIDPEKLIYQRHSVGEVLLEGAEALIKSDMVSIAVIDSLATLLPEVEDNKTLSDNQKIASRAVLVGRFLQKINAVLRDTNTTLLLINQQRVDITASQRSPGGPVIKTTGGMAVEFFPSCKIKLFSSATKSNTLYDSEGTVIGQKVFVTITKNRLAKPRATFETNLVYGRGFDVIMDLIALATDMGILNLSGAWYKYEDKSIAQGAGKLYNVLLDDRKLLDELLNKVFFLFGIHAPEYSKVVDEYLNPAYGRVIVEATEDTVDEETGEVISDE